MNRPLVSATCAAMVAAVTLATAMPAAGNAPDGADSGDWIFRVTLDDKPIGEHRFVVQARGDTRNVTSRARFDIRMLGFVAYRYRHEAHEVWRGGCLVSLDSTTDDDGKPSQVRRTFDSGCHYTFAYWNPAMLKQSQLINAQTGRIENVRITRIGEGQLVAAGVATRAQRWRIEGTEQPIDLWYSMQGAWLGLDTRVAGGRRLSYRLETSAQTASSNTRKETE